MPEHQSSILFAIERLTAEGIVTAVSLLVMSLLSWTVLIGKWFALRKAAKRAAHFYTRFGEAKDAFELVGQDAEFEAAPPYSVYDYACSELKRLLQRFAPAVRANGGSHRAPGRVMPTIRAAMERGMADESSRMEGGMVILALAISGGPFIGLFGTVIGVMETFAGVGQAGQANFVAVAPGVAAALLNTGIGLLVAIPALFGFNLLQRRIQVLEVDMVTFASELEALIMLDYVDEGGDHASQSANRSMPSSQMAVSH